MTRKALMASDFMICDCENEAQLVPADDCCDDCVPVDKAYRQPRPRTPDELDSVDPCDHEIGMQLLCSGHWMPVHANDDVLEIEDFVANGYCPDCGEKLEAVE